MTICCDEWFDLEIIAEVYNIKYDILFVAKGNRGLYYR